MLLSVLFCSTVRAAAVSIMSVSTIIPSLVETISHKLVNNRPLLTSI